MHTSGYHRPNRRPRVPMAFDRMVEQAGDTTGVARGDLKPGDRLMVSTRNSVYTIRMLPNQRFEVTGGWFDRQGEGPMTLTIVGCTWGGSAVKRDMVAICGMRIEFGNRVITSPVKRVVVFPGDLLN